MRKLLTVLVIGMALLLAGCPSPVVPGGGSGSPSLSDNADLATLSLDEAGISPAFAADVVNYTATVAYETEDVTVHATVDDSGAKIVSGAGIQPVDVGENTLNVVVEAEDSSTKTYTITVTREPEGPSSNANLLTLALDGIEISPDFDPNVTEYTATVPYATTSVTVVATEAHSKATIDSGTGAKAIVEGDNTLEVIVKAEDESTKTYTITVTREALSSNADLASLEIDGVTLSPTFSPATTAYTATVANSVTSIDVEAVADHSKATITSGTGNWDLNVGTNAVEIVVTAEDASTKTYTVTITREPSTNAKLATLAVAGATLSPAFDPDVTSYTVNVKHSVEDVTISATTQDSTATILSGTGEQALAIGSNTFNVLVQAEDGTTQEEYSITVYITFNAQNLVLGTWYTVQTTLEAVGDHSLVYVQKGQGVSTAQAEDVATEFDDNVYDLITENFAAPSDMDGNGKVIFLLLDILDGYAGSGGYVAGYFDATHQFATTTYSRSNEAEMLFMDVNPAVPGSDGFNETLAHEYQHLVNFSATFLVTGTRQDVWLNEGLSTGAEYLYAGAQVTSRIDYYNADPYQSIVQGNNFFVWNGFWESSSAGVYQDAVANYATAYLFFQYLQLHASNNTAIYKDILNSTYRDHRAVLESVKLRFPSTAAAWTWEDLLGTWMQANFLSYYGSTGLQSYNGEITPTTDYLPVGAGSFALSQGEGLYAATNTLTSSYTYPGGSGADIRYIGLDVTTYAADTSNPYAGQVVLVFNRSTATPNTDTAQTALLPNVDPGPLSSILNIQNTSNYTLPESYPIGVQLQPGGGLVPENYSPGAGGRPTIPERRR